VSPRPSTTIRASALALALALAPVGCSAGGDTVDAVDASVFDYDADTDLNLVEGGAIELPFPDTDVHPISYDSPGGPVTGYIAYPPEGTSAAGIIAMHGMPERAEDMIELPLALMGCFGATAIAIDAPYARADRMDTPLLFNETDRDETIQLVVDLRRAVDVLESKGIERITYDGVSWSADAGGILAGVEPRVDGFAIMVGGLVIERFMRDGSPIGPLAEQPDDVVDDWLRLMATVSAERFVGDATAPISFRSNRGDTIVTPENAERLHAAAGPDHEVQWYDDSPDPAGHDMSLQMVVDHIHWQTDLLGLERDRVDACLAPLADLFPSPPS
jgi:dienelactone hydrolase